MLAGTSTHAHVRTRTHTRTHEFKHARAHTHTHTHARAVRYGDLELFVGANWTLRLRGFLARLKKNQNYKLVALGATDTKVRLARASANPPSLGMTREKMRCAASQRLQ